MLRCDTNALPARMNNAKAVSAKNAVWISQNTCPFLSPRKEHNPTPLTGARSSGSHC